MSRRSDFLNAVNLGDRDMVHAMLTYSPELIYTTADSGISIILSAVYYGHKDLALELSHIKQDIDLFEATAIGDGQKKVSRMLKDDPNLINQHSDDGFSALGLACFLGQINVVKLLLEKSAAINKPSQNIMNVYPIHSAGAHRNPETALELTRLLLDYGADPNVKQEGGWTPLHQAISNNNEPLVLLLLENGADTYQTNDNGLSPIQMTIDNGFDELTKLIKSFQPIQHTASS